MPGAQITLMIVRSGERCSAVNPAPVGVPRTLSTSRGSDSAHSSSSRTAPPAFASASAFRQSATKVSTSNIRASFPRCASLGGGRCCVQCIVATKLYAWRASMEVRHVRSFIAVAEAGSFAAAAARLGITQPALWRQVRTLESTLGVPLFDRVGRRVPLPGQGEQLVIRGRELLAHSQSFAEQARSFGAGDAGVLRLGATPQVLESLASFLARWRRAMPRVSLQLVEDGGTRLYERLDAGDVQLAITVAGDPRFHYRLLRPARLLAIVPAGHRLAAKRMVEVSD